MFLVFIGLLLVGLGYGMGIEEVLEKAMKKNPELRAMVEEREAFKGIELSLSAFPNPEVGFESGFLLTDLDARPRGRALYLLDMSQRVPLWGIRGKGRRLARSMSDVFSWNMEVKKRKVMGEVYSRFYEALFRKELVRIGEESLRVSEGVLEFVRTAFRLGEVTELELYRAKRERDIVRAELEILRAEFRASLKRLSEVVGEEVREVEGDLSRIRRLRDLVPEEVPSVKALQAEAEVFNRRIELERAKGKPDLSVGFILEDSSEGYYGLRGTLSVGIPIFYRRQGEILEAVSRKKAVGRLREGELFRVKQRMDSIMERYEALTSSLKALEESTIPTARKELELALRSYRLRSITLLELSDTRRRYYELLTKRAEILRDLHEVYSEYISLGGWRP